MNDRSSAKHESTSDLGGALLETELSDRPRSYSPYKSREGKKTLQHSIYGEDAIALEISHRTEAKDPMIHHTRVEDWLENIRWMIEVGLPDIRDIRDQSAFDELARVRDLICGHLTNIDRVLNARNSEKSESNIDDPENDLRVDGGERVTLRTRVPETSDHFFQDLWHYYKGRFEPLGFGCVIVSPEAESDLKSRGHDIERVDFHGLIADRGSLIEYWKRRVSTYPK